MKFLLLLGLLLDFCLVAQTSFTPIRVNAGGPVYTDASGATWTADTGFSGGAPWSTAAGISGTSSPALYQTCRYGEFVYRFAVTNGNYAVNLKFAEVSQTRAGDRVFNVDINGVTVLANFDVFAEAGGMNIALDKSFPVSVTGDQIAIQFRNGPANSPLIGAVEIVSASTAGATVVVRPGDDLQGAIDAAAPGDTIVLQAGAVYSGGYYLPNKSGSQYITIQSSALASLPADGSRVSPADAGNMPRIESFRTNVFYTEAGAHHYRFVGLELAAAAGANIDTVVAIGSGSETSDADLPHDIEIDRCYIHGDPSAGSKRGISINGRQLTIRDSYLTDFKRIGQDSQAIAGWNGTQFVTIRNNFLEAAAEVILFTADALLPQYLPQDITIQGNHLHRPLSWKADDPSFSGTHWSIKNLLEFKAGIRVLVDGNLLENTWAADQVGFAILVFSQGPTWGTSQNITISNNIIRHVANGIEVCGQACSQTSPSTPVENIVIDNNYFEDVGTPQWLPAGNGRLFQVLRNAYDVHITHNTAMQNANILFGDDIPCPGLVFTDNIVLQAWSGVVGSGYASGTASLNQYFPGAVFLGNVLIGANASIYPAGNYFPSNTNAVGFTNPSSGDYSLVPSSYYTGLGSDGTNPGVDWNALIAAQAVAFPANPGPIRVGRGRGIRY